MGEYEWSGNGTTNGEASQAAGSTFGTSIFSPSSGFTESYSTTQSTDEEGQEYYLERGVTEERKESERGEANGTKEQEERRTRKEVIESRTGGGRREQQKLKRGVGEEREKESKVRQERDKWKERDKGRVRT